MMFDRYFKYLFLFHDLIIRLMCSTDFPRAYHKDYWLQLRHYYGSKMEDILRMDQDVINAVD